MASGILCRAMANAMKITELYLDDHRQADRHTFRGRVQSIDEQYSVAVRWIVFTKAVEALVVGSSSPVGSEDKR